MNVLLPNAAYKSQFRAVACKSSDLGLSPLTQSIVMIASGSWPADAKHHVISPVHRPPLPSQHTEPKGSSSWPKQLSPGKSGPDQRKPGPQSTFPAKPPLRGTYAPPNPKPPPKGHLEKFCAPPLERRETAPAHPKSSEPTAKKRTTPIETEASTTRFHRFFAKNRRRGPPCMT